ncbi:hypothetical protein HMF8227_02362 [Saliniradius amylolyticus]|uniref:Uncharacterized protein n=2 Tax=Saliniradius amylolyticus TaxID=2183582 RepID=A0A2S2E580_9ALTE|nr:hypothetical protein HMF8227_02362 [Saliniradius amylolyticus]
MNIDYLINELQISLGDTAEHFEVGGDFSVGGRRLIDAALSAYSQHRPRTKPGKLLLVSGQMNYTAPVDLIGFKMSNWGHSAPLWQPNRPRSIPRPTLVGERGSYALCFNQAPSLGHIQCFGREYHYLYYAEQSVNENGDLLLPRTELDLVMLRAQAEAMKELSMHHSNKTVSANNSVASPAKNDKPIYVYQQLMAEFEERIRA